MAVAPYCRASRSFATSRASRQTPLPFGDSLSIVDGSEVTQALPGAHSMARHRASDTIKLMAVVLPPLVALGTISYLVLIQALATIEDTQQMEDHLRTSDAIRNLVHMLQRERGITCIYLGSNNGVTEELMAQIGNNQDDVDQAMISWFAANDMVDVEKKEAFKLALRRHRQAIWHRKFDCYYNTIWFGSQIDNLLMEINAVFGQARDGRLWNTIASYLIGLKGKELIGRKRAIGGPFFANNNNDLINDFALFNRLQCGADHLFDQSYVSNPAAGAHMKSLSVKNSDLISHLEDMNIQVLAHNVTDRGSNRSLDWFYSMTAYIDLLSDVEQNTTKTLIGMLKLNIEHANVQYITVIIAVSISLVVCSVLLLLYVYQARKLMTQIQNFTQSLAKRTRELNLEKQKTDMILFQILPVSIANRLKRNEVVTPELYDEVTIYFSDILGFTTLAEKSTPMEVIELLNELYTSCDEILNRYDVYKVETIGDAYMVASGVPKRIQNLHSNEICTMALDILKMMESFQIPHRPTESLLIRIGIHSGPCVAGIVGTKMPRYCLFGDTVNTASRMESTGSALRIHISENTQYHLRTNFRDEFHIIQRGDQNIKGKGAMRTYWLMGKMGFPFRIDLAVAADKVEEASYWKTEEPSLEIGVGDL